MQKKPVARYLSPLRDLLEIIRDYGMPTVAFGVGIYGVLLLLRTGASPELTAAIAFALTVIGLLAQIWVYARENPRVRNDEVRDQLQRMTALVEKAMGKDVKGAKPEE